MAGAAAARRRRMRPSTAARRVAAVGSACRNSSSVAASSALVVALISRLLLPPASTHEVGGLESRLTGLVCREMIAAAQATLRVASFVGRWSGDSAAPADLVRKIRAHVHTVSQSAA